MNPDTDPHPAPPARRSSLALVLILLLSFGVFAPTLLNGFTYDDPHYARLRTPAGDRNPMVAELHPFAEYWRKPMNWGLPSTCRGFRPVTVYSYALVNAAIADPGNAAPEAHSGEDTAWLHHLCNLLLHVLATALVFLLARGLAGTAAACIGALVFGVHAVHSGPVAAIVGRAELLAFVLGATALLTYTAALRHTGAARGWRLLATALAGLLAFGSKESAVAWAAFVPLYAMVRGVGLRRQVLPALCAIALPLAVFLWLRADMLATHVTPRGPFWVEHDANPLYYLPFLERVVQATPILAYAAGKVLWPTYLSSNYGDGPFAVLSGPLDWRFLLSATGLLATVALGVRARRRHPLLFLATAAFFGFSFITSNIPFPIETIFGDRLLYTPSLGAVLLATWLATVLRGRGRLVGAAVLVAFVVHSSWTSVQRSIAWHDHYALTSLDLRNQPDSVGLHIDMGNLHLWNFDQKSAVREFRAALRIRPESPRALRFLAEQLPPAQAEPLLQRALRSPRLVPATEGRRVHWALANLHERAGRSAAAWRSYQAALDSNPYAPDVRLHMLRETAARGDWAAFDRLLDDGLALDPDNPYFTMHRGTRLHHRGEYRAAITAFAAVLEQLPEHAHVVEAWLRLADCYLRTGQPERARAIAERFSAAARKLPTIRAELHRILQATVRPGPGR